MSKNAICLVGKNMEKNSNNIYTKDITKNKDLVDLIYLMVNLLEHI